jgi:hypothetical protein
MIFRNFISAALKDFKKHLQVQKMKDSTITERMKGATEFAKFLVGEPHQYGERTKDTI